MQPARLLTAARLLAGPAGSLLTKQLLPTHLGGLLLTHLGCFLPTQQLPALVPLVLLTHLGCFLLTQLMPALSLLSPLCGPGSEGRRGVVFCFDWLRTN